MPFGLKNEPSIFSRIVIRAFQEYLYKTMEIYSVDWTIYSLLRDHVKWIWLMLEHCKKIQVSLNIKKCISSTHIGILIGKLVCKYGIKVNLTKVKVVLNLKPPTNPKKIRAFMGYVHDIITNLVGSIQHHLPHG